LEGDLFGSLSDRLGPNHLGFARARYDAPQLWTPPPGARHVTMLLMLVSLILLASYLFKRSHTAVITHHPMVWSVLLWSAGHLFANGSPADAVLFGAFLIWSIADLASAYARDRRNGAVYPTPELGATAGAVVVGLVLYGVLIGGLHLWLFGVSPLGM
ncbi:MAG TPA: NnrU family protein, partial [Roseiarcus sp.]